MSRPREKTRSTPRLHLDVKGEDDAPLEADRTQARADDVAARPPVREGHEPVAVAFDALDKGQRASLAGSVRDVVIKLQQVGARLGARI